MVLVNLDYNVLVYYVLILRIKKNRRGVGKLCYIELNIFKRFYNLMNLLNVMFKIEVYFNFVFK